MGPEDIGTCTLRNSFNYAPAIHIEKVNNPTLVRGDLDPPAQVTSSYVVTNPGNTALHGVTVIDDTCGPVTPVPTSGPNAGDTDGDAVLDPGEAWQFNCTLPIQESITDDPINMTNSVVVAGTDPTGTVVTDNATDDYEVVTPAIRVVKDVEGGGQGPQNEITVPVGTDVTYTYAVTNHGNVPLTDVATDGRHPAVRVADVRGRGHGWRRRARPDRDVDVHLRRSADRHGDEHRDRGGYPDAGDAGRPSGH